MIDILIPVLGRPHKAQAVCDSIHAATKVPYEIYFVCSASDEEEIQACFATDAHHVVLADWEPDFADYPRKMNFAYRVSSNPYLLLGADDLDFEPGWDEKVLALGERTAAGVIGTNDMANRSSMRGHSSTHPVVRRSYVDELGGSLDGPGVLIHEGYDHNYCERELNHLAQKRKLWAFAKDAIIRHRHPCWGTEPNDAIYDKGKRNFHEDHVLFLRRSRQWGMEGLLPQEIAWLRMDRKRERRARA